MRPGTKTSPEVCDDDDDDDDDDQGGWSGLDESGGDEMKRTKVMEM